MMFSFLTKKSRLRALEIETAFSISLVIPRVGRLFYYFFYQGVQRPGKPGNVMEFRCKEKKSARSQRFLKNKKSQGILLCGIYFQPV